MICPECGKPITKKEFWVSKTTMENGTSVTVHIHAKCQAIHFRTFKGLKGLAVSR